MYNNCDLFACAILATATVASSLALLGRCLPTGSICESEIELPVTLLGVLEIRKRQTPSGFCVVTAQINTEVQRTPAIRLCLRLRHSRKIHRVITQKLHKF